MKISLLELIACPECKGPYQVQSTDSDGEEVMEGSLICSCGRKPIVRGVPRLLPGDVDAKNWETASRFGEEWKQFDMITDKYEKQFLSWIEPVKRDFFQDKIVLDVGCGKGRHVLQAHNFGAKMVIGVDLSQAVDAAFKNVGRLPNVHIIQGDLYALPVKPIFDYAYSIGVLHHTPDPKKSFMCMVDRVKNGGAVSAWVYGREGNGWIIHLLNPVRRITSRLPLPIVKFLAFILAVSMQVGLKLFYWPAEHVSWLGWLKGILPYSPYLCSIADYSFRENFSIVFDHLLPEIAFYIRQEEFEAWFRDAKLTNINITQRNKNSWRGYGERS